MDIQMAATGGRAETGDDVHFEALFRSAEHAVRSAYSTESKSIVKVSSFFSDLRGGSVPLGLREPMTPHDVHAQAAMILAMLERHLPVEEMIVVRARYTIPTTRMLELRKRRDQELIFEIITDRSDMPEMPKYYVQDVIRGWTGERRHHDDTWWANNLGRDTRLLRYWCNGRADRNWFGIVALLSDIQTNAINRMTEPMYRSGLTRE
jgi:hypothetical protein